MDHNQWNPYFNYFQNPTGDTSQNFQMCPRPSLPSSDGSQNPQSFMFQSPPFSTGNNSQYPRPFMFQLPPTNITSQYTHPMGTNNVVESHNVQLESPIGSTTNSQDSTIPI
ncbi:hypothetical protein QL285_092098 [Trifolium repens]|jgi:hypothetical protein|nr:hypothetical protein QL285_092098 [Trifolium repens]